MPVDICKLRRNRFHNYALYMSTLIDKVCIIKRLERPLHFGLRKHIQLIRKTLILFIIFNKTALLRSHVTDVKITRAARA